MALLLHNPHDVRLRELQAQVTELESLRAEVAQLRERLGQNSSNSSKPPSEVKVFKIRPGRGKKDALAVLGRKFAGVANTDRYNAYTGSIKASGSCAGLI